MFAVSLGAIVLMYLLKRKYVDTVVPSHVLWNRVLQNMEANRPWQKLRNRLLLWLQLLAAALLVLALMQPYVATDKKPGSHIVLVADVSASMSAEDAEGTAETRLAKLQAAMRDYVRGPAEGASISLLRMGGRPELLESRQTSTDKVLQSIDGLRVDYGKTAYRETMSLAASLARTDKDAEIVLYTDGQWPETAEGLSFPVPVRTELINGNSDNVGIAQFGVKASGDGAVQGVAVIRNGSAEARKVEAALRYGDKTQEVKQLTLGPGERQTVRFERLAPAAVYGLTIDAKDTYAADNAAYAFMSEQGPKRALLVTQGNLFLEKALQLAGAEVTKIMADGKGVANVANAAGSAAPDTGALPLPEGRYDFIVLDRVPAGSIASDQWKSLLAHNPVWLIGQSGAKAVNGGLFQMKDHPVTQYIRFEDVHVAEAAADAPPVWGTPIVEAGGTPLVFAGTEQGQRRLAFAFDLHRTDLPLRSEFPILVRNAAEWLSGSQSQSIGRVVAGSTQEVPLSGAAVSGSWLRLEGPVKGAEMAASASHDGSAALSSLQTVPSVPGLYRFVQKDAAGAEVSSLLAEVAADASESNVGLRAELAFHTDGAGIEQTDSQEAGVAGTGKEAKFPIAPWIGALIMLLILLEWGVYQRGDSI